MTRVAFSSPATATASHICTVQEFSNQQTQYTTKTKVNLNVAIESVKHTDKRCWFKPPFASIMKKPLELDPGAETLVLMQGFHMPLTLGFHASISCIHQQHSIKQQEKPRSTIKFNMTFYRIGTPSISISFHHRPETLENLWTPVNRTRGSSPVHNIDPVT